MDIVVICGTDTYTNKIERKIYSTTMLFINAYLDAEGLKTFKKIKIIY
jgi:hypothetical protein